MKLELFFNFDGNCREAVEFYAKVFKTEVMNLMTYGETPPDPSCPAPEEDKDKIMYASLEIGGMYVMFMDMPSDTHTTAGDNINPTISLDDKDEITRVWNALKEDGEVYMELCQTFFSELYGMVKDKYGIIWHILYHVPQN